jgi:hypothetical protein
MVIDIFFMGLLIASLYDIALFLDIADGLIGINPQRRGLS